MSLPYMPLYIEDYMKDAGYLPTVGHGAYMLLIMAYWQRQEPLPADDFVLMGTARLSAEEWAWLKPHLAKFFQERDGLWHHKRIDEEIVRARTKLEQARSAGRARAQQKLNGRHAPAQHPLSARSAPAQADAPKGIGIDTHSSSEECVAREREFRFAISAEYERAGFLPPDTGRAIVWLQNGWQEAICIEAVRSGLARKRKALPLTYFDGQIADAHAPVPIGRANQRAGPPQRPMSAAAAILQRARESQSDVRDYPESQSLVIDTRPDPRESG